MADQMIDLPSFFSDVQDPRINRRRLHKFLDIIVIGMCSILAGCEGFSDMEVFGNAKKDWFSKFLELEHGIPSHDTFRRVFTRINPKQFAIAFTRWTRSLVGLLDNKHIAIDGKCLRSSRRKSTKQSPVHLVSAWCADNKGLLIGQEKVASKSNEIKAIPEILNVLDLAGAIVTIDAIGCQKKIAAQIVEQGGDYALAVKGNQKTLFEKVKNVADKYVSGASRVTKECFHDYFDRSHGRTARRRTWTISDIEELNIKEDWPSIKSVFVVESMRCVGKGPITSELRYYVSSMEKVTGKKADSLIRGHWSIENQLHWSLDVTFNEDNCRVADNNAACNLGAMRRIAISMLKQIKDGLSLRKRKLKCGFDNNYLAKVLSAIAKI